MADEADQTGERMAVQEAAEMQKGVPGECERCSEPSWRLVGGNCAPCRDKFKLP